jgi:hypothetical protein
MTAVLRCTEQVVVVSILLLGEDLHLHSMGWCSLVCIRILHMWCTW